MQKSGSRAYFNKSYPPLIDQVHPADFHFTREKIVPEVIVTPVSVYKINYQSVNAERSSSTGSPVLHCLQTENNSHQCSVLKGSIRKGSFSL